jgi:hypothetical protein
VTEDPTDRELATWRAYEQYGTYRLAIAARQRGDVTPDVPATIPMFRRVLSSLYAKLGAVSQVQAGRLLREKHLL